MTAHTKFVCPPDCDLRHCCYHEGDLFACTVCGGLEGSLTTECCGRQITDGEEFAIYTLGALDFRDGQWRAKQKVEVSLENLTLPATPAAASDDQLRRERLAQMLAEDRPVPGAGDGLTDAQVFARLARAESALLRAGFTDRGGEEWTPPLAPAPTRFATPPAPAAVPTSGEAVALSDDAIWQFWTDRDCMDAIRAGDHKAQFVSAVRALLAASTGETPSNAVKQISVSTIGNLARQYGHSEDSMEDQTGHTYFNFTVQGLHAFAREIEKLASAIPQVDVSTVTNEPASEDDIAGALDVVESWGPYGTDINLSMRCAIILAKALKQSTPPPAQVRQEDLHEMVIKTKGMARHVFSESCNHTRDAIEYMGEVMDHEIRTLMNK